MKLNLDKDTKVLQINFISLSTIQVITYILPLITIPYLTRALSLEGYGLYVLVLAILAFLDICISYGFKISATDQIAKNRNDINFISKVFYEVLFSKVLISFFIVFIVIISSFFFPTLMQNINLILLGLPFLIGKLIFPIWLFQGLQSMKYVVIAHLIGKVFFITMIFSFVKDQSHLELAVFFYSMCFFITGFLSFYMAHKIYNLSFVLPLKTSIINQLKRGKNIFFQQLSVAFYSTINTIILGIYNPGIPVATYSLGDKVYKIAGSVSGPFNRALFPYLSAQFTDDKNKYFKNLYISLWAIFLIFLFLGTLVFIFSPWILQILAGDQVQGTSAILILKILSCAIPFYALAALTTYHLVTLKRTTTLLHIGLVGAAINTILAFPISIYFSSVGVAYLTLFIMMLISLSQVAYVVSAANRIK